MKSPRSLFLTILPAALALITAQSALAAIPVKSGDKIAFLGDSITAMGAGPSGYCTLVVAGLKANGIDATMIGAGHSGDTSDNMAGRVGPDVLDKKPDWMTLSCGVNDVNNPKFGVLLEKFKTNVTNIVSKAQAAGIKVMILTATPNTETLDSPKNQTLAQYNAFLRDFAAQKHCLLADMNADFQRVIQARKADDSRSPNPGHILMFDALHPNFERGNPEMARVVLRAFGLDDAQIARAEDSWLDLPGTVVVHQPSFPFEIRLSHRQDALLKDIGARHQLTTLDQVVQRLLAAEAAGLPATASAADIEKALDLDTSKANAETVQTRLAAHLKLLTPPPPAQ
jgi:lysophospholipase L1-like esterase